MFHFKINYVRRRFFFWPFWYVRVEITGTKTWEEIDAICSELQKTGAQQLNVFRWNIEHRPYLRS